MNKLSLIDSPIQKTIALKAASKYIKEQLQFVPTSITPAPPSIEREELESLQSAVEYYAGKDVEQVYVTLRPKGIRLIAYMESDFDRSTLRIGSGTELSLNETTKEAFRYFWAGFYNANANETFQSAVLEVYLTSDNVFVACDVLRLFPGSPVVTLGLNSDNITQLCRDHVLLSTKETVNIGTIKNVLGEGTYIVKPDLIEDEPTYAPALIVRDEETLRLSYGSALDNPADLYQCITLKNIRYSEALTIGQFNHNRELLSMCGQDLRERSEAYQLAMAEAHANNRFIQASVDSRLLTF